MIAWNKMPATKNFKKIKIKSLINSATKKKKITNCVIFKYSAMLVMGNLKYHQFGFQQFLLSKF